MRDRAVEVVVFDLGGVLVELDLDWPRYAGLEPAATFAWFATSPEYRAYECGELSEARFLRALGAAFPDGDPSRFAEAFGRCIAGHYPGAIALLDDLRATGVRTAALSNTNRLHWQVFDPERHLRSRLEPALASHHLGARKPELDVFARASAILGTPSVLFLDDSADNVRAARAAGWQAARVVGPAAARDALRDHGIALPA